MKKCTKCKIEKPRSEFHARRNSSAGLKSNCKACGLESFKKWQASNPGATKPTAKAWRERNPDYALDRYRLYTYGLDRAAFDALWAQQDGVCAICQANLSDRRLAHVDHCHDTGVVRGLLCRNCNIGLDNFSDEPERLRKAAEYLDRATQLAYKAIRHQVLFKEVNEAYSTQTCSQCASIEGPKGLKGLGIRQWTCGCGSVHDRDINAAKNIARRGLASLGVGASA